MADQHHPAIAVGLSPARLHRYLADRGGDLERALRLYQWNTDLSAAVFGLLQHAEVVLRNAIAGQLHELRVRRGDSTGRWFWSDTDPWFAPWWRHEMRRQLRNAERTIARQHEVTEGRMVAELSLGFWRYVLTSHYEASLWTPALHRAFKPGLARADVHALVEQLNVLRNRIAHHEPIYNRALVTDVLRVEQLLDWIDPHVTEWVMESAERVRQVWTARPD